MGLKLIWGFSAGWWSHMHLHCTVHTLCIASTDGSKAQTCPNLHVPADLQRSIVDKSDNFPDNILYILMILVQGYPNSVSGAPGFVITSHIEAVFFFFFSPNRLIIADRQNQFLKNAKQRLHCVWVIVSGVVYVKWGNRSCLTWMMKFMLHINCIITISWKFKKASTEYFFSFSKCIKSSH